MGVGKRSRVEIAPEYRARYTREMLAAVDLTSVLEELPRAGAGALMCVSVTPRRVPVDHRRAARG
jgi:hypothetical protein